MQVFSEYIPNRWTCRPGAGADPPDGGVEARPVRSLAPRAENDRRGQSCPRPRPGRTVGLSPAGKVSMAKAITLVDNFNATVFDTIKWTVPSTAQQTNRRVEIRPL